MNLLSTLPLPEDLETIGNCQRSKELFGLVRFKGSSSSTETVQTTSAEQQATAEEVSRFINQRLTGGVPGFEGQLTADIPDIVQSSFDSFSNQDRSLSDAERSSLSSLATGESFFESDPEQIIQDWRENFANPLTSYYNEFVRPEVREEFNVPGGFNTSERSEGVSRAFNEFYGKNVAPTLFQAQENERAREFAAKSQASAQQLPALQFQQALPGLELGQAFAGASGFQSFEQQDLSARYNEFLRQAIGEQNFAQIGAGFGTASTVDTVVQQGSGGTNYGALGGAALGALLAGSATGGLGAGQGALVGASIGGQAGF